MPNHQLDISDESYALLKAYAALKKLNIDNALEHLILSNEIIKGLKDLKKVSNGV